MIKLRFFKAYCLSQYPYCQWCEKPLTMATATADHIVAEARGGKTHPANLCLACMECNGEKSNNNWGFPKHGPQCWRQLFDTWVVNRFSMTRSFEERVMGSFTKSGGRDNYWLWKLEHSINEKPEIADIQVEDMLTVTISCSADKMPYPEVSIVLWNILYRMTIREHSLELQYKLVDRPTLAFDSWDYETLYNVLRIYESGCVAATNKGFPIGKIARELKH